jgi:nucleoside-diphosphate-sugar epimerase
MSSPKVLVTGASGFVGEALVFRLLVDKTFRPIAAARGVTRLHGLCPVVPFDLTDAKVLPALDDIQVVIHAAARVHIMNETTGNALAEFRKANVDGTIKLARCAAASGVKRFIFISSIKVNGESTVPGVPFTGLSEPAPVDPYGISKLEAEQALKQISLETGMEVVIIRPPLVYGPRVKANFLSMMRWLDKGIPLPLGAIYNQRSLVALGNLVDLIVTCIEHPNAPGGIFLVSDDEYLSTTSLLQRLSIAMGRPARLLPVPVKLLKLTAVIFGRESLVQRLCESLQVDISMTRERLDWSPPVSMQKAFCQTVEFYRSKQSR